MTHNFDFFRTIQSRLNLGRKNCLLADKNSNHIVRLTKIEGQNILRPFDNWKANLNDDAKLIASIPFVRQLVQYKKGSNNPHYKLLTSLLHIKEGTTETKKTQDILIEDLKLIYEDSFEDISFPTKQGSLLQLIYDTADQVQSSSETTLKLENKIVLSIAIRLISEEFMLSKITTNSSIEGNQTRVLFDKYVEEFTKNDLAIETLEEVMLMTPEHIHLNSFMYEPILDMSSDELTELYKHSKLLKGIND